MVHKKAPSHRRDGAFSLKRLIGPAAAAIRERSAAILEANARDVANAGARDMAASLVSCLKAG